MASAIPDIREKLVALDVAPYVEVPLPLGHG
jgi:hypothetical protein